MNFIKDFNPKRFFLLIRNDLFLNRSYFLIFSGVIAVIILLLSILEIIKPGSDIIYRANYRILLYVAGILIGGKIFKGLHNEVQGSAWLTLPASILEKFLSRLILLEVLVPLWLMALFFLMSLFLGLGYSVFAGSFPDVFNPFNRDILMTTLRYFILISVYHLGLIYFKKDALGRTFLSLFIYQLLLFVIAIAGFRIFFGELFSDFLFIADPLRTIPELLNGNGQLEQLWSITKWAIHIVFWYLLAPLCWLTGYFRLKEKEV